MKSIAAIVLCSLAPLAAAQTNDELVNSGKKNGDNVTTFGMGYDLKQWSPLKEIDKTNVKRLVPVWSTALMNEIGELSQPTVYNGVMYVVNGNFSFALDVETGKQIWRTPVQYDRGALRVASNGAIMRGPATIYNGKLFRETLDAHVMALDMKTGKELWKSKYGDWKEGYKGVIAPMIANGVLLVGQGGSDSTARGFVAGYDPDTGKELWRTWTIPEPGQPGSETWPHKTKPDAWKPGGGTTWQYFSYDPELDLAYVGTGNAQPYNPQYRGDGGDALYTASVIALKPKTGQMAWHYQYTPNDAYDFDGNAEGVLADVRIDGKLRKVLINANKNGFMYVIDRTNGKLINAYPFVRTSWASKIDLNTGRPVLTDLLDRAMKGETVRLDPARATNSTLTAYNPKTGTLFLNPWNQARIMSYVDYKMEPGSLETGIKSTFDTPKGEPMGYHTALDPLTGKVKWQVPLMDYASSAGLLATDGGLVFTGLLTGEFIALDQDTGKRLWQFKTGSSVNAPPITYTYKGRQYVTVLSGRGGSNPTRFAGPHVPAGGAVYTFALMRD